MLTSELPTGPAREECCCSLQHPLHCPPFPTTTIIVGDSITKYVCFFNAITHCYPETKVVGIVEKLSQLLTSLPPSITGVIIHVGTNKTALSQSERTKKDFKELFNLLKNWTVCLGQCPPCPCCLTVQIVSADCH